MLKSLLHRLLGIQSPSAMWDGYGPGFAEGFDQGVARAEMGPHGPPIRNDDGTVNAEGVRIFLEEMGPVVDRLRPAARAAIWYEEEEEEEDNANPC